MITRQVDELLKGIDANATFDVQVEALRAAVKHNRGMAAILDINFADSCKFAESLGTGYPSNVILDMECPEGMGQTTMVYETKNLGMFFEANAHKYKPELLMKKFTQLLESLHFGEAEVLVFAKDKALHELEYANWITRQHYDSVQGTK